MLVKVLRAIADRSPTFVARFLFNLYPPYLGAGVQVEEISPDYRYLRVRLKFRFYNKNYVGTQFGGSIYAMTDPHYMLLLIKNLGAEYVVWDKAAHIEFLKPGRTDLRAEFRIEDAVLETIREKTMYGDKYIFDLPVAVHDVHGEMIARLTKTLYVRRKRTA